MSAKVVSFILFLLIISNLSANDKSFFIIKKDSIETKKIIEKYLIDSNYEVKEMDGRVFEIYFDLPELTYLKQGGYIKYKAIEYLSKKKQNKKYIESIEYSFDGNITYSYPVKHYNSVKSFEEKHPLLSLVKRKDREIFLNRLHADGLKYPMRLKNIVQVSKLVHTIEIYSDSISQGSIKVNKIKSSVLENHTIFSLLEINLNSTLFKKEIDINLNNEYSIVYKEMSERIQFFSWVLKYPYIINLLYAIGFGMIGILVVLTLLRWKRT